MKNKIVMTSGLALFAMFFGAGNIIYPLALGARAGDHIWYVMGAFLVSGIGLPFLGLFATSLYQGDYWAFFGRLGKVPAFMLITFLILIIGPFFAIPRTETITYHTIQSFLPPILDSQYLISALYCGILLVLSYRHNKVVDVIGRILSPIKLSLFAVLIIAGLTMSPHEILPNNNPIMDSVKMGLLDGYSTMDLLATFFFCSIVCQNILAKTKVYGITDTPTVIKIFLKACFVGGALLGVVYIGFMLLALFHAPSLEGVGTAQMIVAVSNLVLGKFGSLFVGICVSFACIVTAIALTDISTSFIHEQLARKKLPRNLCLVISISITYAMSILGFAWIMKIALPILQVLYPALIIYCIINIVTQISVIKKKAFDNRTNANEVLVS